MSIDFGKTASDYSQHRAGFPDVFFERLAPFGVGLPGQHILDMGTGTGGLARGLALRGAAVTGLDPAAPLLRAARQLDRAADVEISYLAAVAEASALAADRFDVVTAGQCWHWFDSLGAAHEARRLLVSGGVLVIAYFDWLRLPGNVVEASEDLIKTHNPEWVSQGQGLGIYPEWPRDVAVAGFQEIETFSFDVTVRYSHEAWRGRIRASAGIAASLEPAQVARFDVDHGRLLAKRFPADPLTVPHRVFAVVCQAP